MNIEILWFKGCPNHHAARALVEEVLREQDIEATIETVEVPDLETGERVRFPGSPTIRVDGKDVEPGYEDTGDYTPRCRVYMTPQGYKGVPDRAWIYETIKVARESARASIR